MKKKYSLTCFFPCYNDAGTIGSLVTAADKVSRELTGDYEIIVVDDKSTDNSKEILVSLKDKFPTLKVIYHEKNQGYGGALISGFRAGTKDLLFYTDGDAQYDVFELKKIFVAMQDGVDVVNGYKIERNDPLHRVIIGKLYLVIMRILFSFKVRDVDCDYRLLRKSVLDSIQLKHTSGVICIELVKKLELAGSRFVDFPVHHYFRTYGKSQFFNLKRIFRTGINILKLWWELMILRDLEIEKIRDKKYTIPDRNKSLEL